MKAVTEQSSIIGDLHAATQVVSKIVRRRALLRALHGIITAQLELKAYDLSSPMWKTHAKAILAETVDGHMQTVGRLDDVQERVRLNCKDVQTEARMEKALQLITLGTSDR